MRKLSPIFVVIVLIVATAIPSALQAGQNLSVDDLIKKLQNSTSPSVAGKPPTAGEDRETKEDENEEAASGRTNRKRPSVDLEVFFEYNSAAITTQAIPVLVKLGKAMIDNRLSTDRFLVAGHTDAKGSDSYNLELSRRRATAIRKFLMTTFQINGSRLIAVGYGEEQLKVKSNPNSAVNRRVQIVNITGQ